MPEGLLHGLKVAAVAVVAQAVWGMARSLCPDAPRLSVMALAATAVIVVPSPWCQVAVMLAAGLAGARWFRPAQAQPHAALRVPIGPRAGAAFLLAFVVLLVALPLAHRLFPSQPLAMFDAFYRAGALVFGGGHVVLPLLQAAVVPTGWVDGDTFLAGYGAAQAVPGPLFTFAAFLGARDARGAFGLGRRHALPRGDLRAVVPAGLWGAAVLGSACAATPVRRRHWPA